MSRLSWEHRANLISLYCLILIFGVSGNSCVLYSLIFSKVNRQKIQNYYLLALSIANNLFCSVYPSYMLSSLIDPATTVQYKISCTIMTFVDYALSVVGIMVITALSLDRYFAVRYPFEYDIHVTSHVVSFINLLAYVFPLACFCPVLVAEKWVQCFGKPGDPSGINWQRLPLAYACILALLLLAIPGIILIVTNVYVFVTARKQYLKYHKNQYPKAKVSRFHIAKINQVSNMYPIYLGDCRNQDHDLIGSHSASCDKPKTNDLEEATSFENGVLNKNTSTRRTCNEDSVNDTQEDPWVSQIKAKNELQSSDLKTSLSCRSVTHSDDQGARIEHDNHLTRAAKAIPTKFDKICLKYVDCQQDVHTDVYCDIKSTVAKKRSCKVCKAEKEKADNILKKQLRMQQHWKMAVMTLALIICFLITWLPFAISRLVASFSKGYPGSAVDYYAAAFTAINSVISPYLILATRKDIRQFLLKRR